MRSSEKTRVWVLALFFAALIVFAMLYKPTDARSLPAGQHYSEQK